MKIPQTLSMPEGLNPWMGPGDRTGDRFVSGFKSGHKPVPLSHKNRPHCPTTVPPAKLLSPEVSPDNL